MRGGENRRPAPQPDTVQVNCRRVRALRHVLFSFHALTGRVGIDAPAPQPYAAQEEPIIRTVRAHVLIIPAFVLALLLIGSLGLARAQDPAPQTAGAPGVEPQTVFLPLISGFSQPTSTPTPTRTPTPAPTATPTPSQVTNPKCYWFPLGPTDSDDVECSATDGLVIRRNNISFTMVACCGTYGARHYAISVDAATVAGEGDYRIGFDVRSLVHGGGYLFGVNPGARSYSLIRIDDSDWKGGVSLIPWTFSDAILPGASFNRLEVERNDAAILLTINGQRVAVVQDTTWVDQGIGWTLYVRNYQSPAEVHMERIRYTQWDAIGRR